jgi:hypothetical protein
MKKLILSRTQETRNASHCVVLPRSIRVSTFYVKKQLMPDYLAAFEKTIELFLLRTLWLLTVTCLI